MSVFNDYFVDTIKYRYADFEGRARRSEYWYFALFYILIYFGIGIASGAISSIAEELGVIILAITGIFILLMIIPNLALTVRRLHDTGKSGWFILIGIIPIVGSIILLVFLVSDSQPGTNMYGPNPKTLDQSSTADHLIDDLA